MLVVGASEVTASGDSIEVVKRLRGGRRRKCMELVDDMLRRTPTPGYGFPFGKTAHGLPALATLIIISRFYLHQITSKILALLVTNSSSDTQQVYSRSPNALP